MIPKPFIYAAIVLVMLALVPPAIIARARAKNSPKPRVHYVQDMDNQGKLRAQHASPLFADGRAMRPLVPGTVARGELAEDEHLHLGVADNDWAATFPAAITVDIDLLRRGQERFGIFCQPCHGLAGYGDGIVHQRAMELVNLGVNGTIWVQPKSLHEQAIREQPVGQVYNSITNGVRNMAAYGAQIPVADRWAIVAYVKALQRSQNARETDVPPEIRESLRYVELPEEGATP